MILGSIRIRGGKNALGLIAGEVDPGEGQRVEAAAAGDAACPVPLLTKAGDLSMHRPNRTARRLGFAPASCPGRGGQRSWGQGLGGRGVRSIASSRRAWRSVRGGANPTRRSPTAASPDGAASAIADRIPGVVLFVAADAPTHRDRLDPARRGHRAQVPVAVAACLVRGTPLLEDEALDVALVVAAHEIRLIVDHFPGDGLLPLPVLEQLLDAGLVLDGLDALMTAAVLVEAGNAGNGAAPRTGMAVQAVDPPIFSTSM